MVAKLLPQLNKIYFINKYTMFHILEGSGGIEVDFKRYHDWKDKLFFLARGNTLSFCQKILR
ncbi:MAG: hypothetical protein ACPG49_13825 [Chitinophagales bacterium]